MYEELRNRLPNEKGPQNDTVLSLVSEVHRALGTGLRAPLKSGHLATQL